MPLPAGSDIDRTPGHVPQLQSLRGLASISVVFSHTWAMYAVPDWFGKIQGSVFNGQIAVVTFFVLSGYVMDRMLQNTSQLENNNWVINFYIRRVFRLYPAIIIASCVGLVYVVGLHYRIPVENAASWYSTRYKADRFNIVGIGLSYLGLMSFLIPTLWSITVEIVASLLFPLYKFASRRTLSNLLFGGCLLAISLLVGARTFYGTGIYLVSFWLGANLKWVITPPASPGGWALARRLIETLGLPALMATSLAAGLIRPDVKSPVFDLLMDLAAAMAIIQLVVTADRPTLFTWRPVVWLGDISYGVYLLHFTVMGAFAKLIQVTTGSGLDTVSRSLLLSALTLAATLPAAHLLYQHVERPGIALGRRIAARRAGR